VNTPPKLTERERQQIRRLAGASRCPVAVVAGGSPPRARGQRGYACFKGGGPCKYPGAARRAGYRVEWEPSTYRVEVGEDWIRRWRLGRRLGPHQHLLSLVLASLTLDTPAAIMADWLADRGHEAAARRLRSSLAGLAGNQQKGLQP